MKTIVKTISILLLLLNGIGALYGGYQLITDPTGSKMQIPLSFLENSPFNDYLIPGIVLFIVNGIFSFVTVATIFLETQKVYVVHNCAGHPAYRLDYHSNDISQNVLRSHACHIYCCRDMFSWLRTLP